MPYDWLITFAASIGVILLVGSFLRRVQAATAFCNVLLVYGFWCVFNDSWIVEHLVSVTWTVFWLSAIILYIDNHRSLVQI